MVVIYIYKISNTITTDKIIKSFYKILNLPIISPNTRENKGKDSPLAKAAKAPKII